MVPIWIGFSHEFLCELSPYIFLGRHTRHNIMIKAIGNFGIEYETAGGGWGETDGHLLFLQTAITKVQ